MAEPRPGGAARVAALLLNFRRADLTRQCLADLLAGSAEPLAVLVIDNGSADGSAEALQQALATMAFGPHHVELLALQENLGFAGGMNRGIAWARARGCPFTLVLNNDLRLPPGWLDPLVAALGADARLGAVGPTLVHPDGTVWAEGGALAARPNGLRLLGHGRKPQPQRHGPEAVDFLPAACVLYRTAALAEVGGFDAGYFMYWEDVDLGVRLVARGYTNLWLPWVRVEHAAGQSSGGGRSPLRKFLMAKNALRFLRQHGRWWQWLAWVVCDLVPLPVALLLRPRSAWAKLAGTWAGLRGVPATAADVRRLLG
ncbi:MAG: glycosyltransferase family 2 protein [Planctomycetes bacterium]|nr:glycosyltransferase family 2 protein [Planctomycetota bacterium]